LQVSSWQIVTVDDHRAVALYWPFHDALRRCADSIETHVLRLKVRVSERKK
jgi:hypothetical protein